MPSNLARLLAFARRLQPTHSLAELLLIARDETRSVVGYDRVWFMVADDDNPNLLRLLEFSGHESTLNLQASLAANARPK